MMSKAGTIPKMAVISVFLTVAIFMAGCVGKQKKVSASKDNMAAESATSSKSKRITEIAFGNDAEKFDIVIRGSRLLPYTSVKQVSPAALFLYFNDTVLDTDKTELTVNNDIVETIRATEVTEKERDVVKVEILMKKNFPTKLPYTISRDGPGVRISFRRVAGASAEPDTGDEKTFRSDAGTSNGIGDAAVSRSPAASGRDAAMSVSSAPAATRLDSVYAARFDDGLKVFVGADGMITKYKASVTTNPPRIIFDLADLRSPFTHEKVIPVNTPWVKMVRYQSYPDRVNLVLETSPEYLNAYSASPVDNGLMIHVGQGGYPNRSVPSVAGQPGIPDKYRFDIDSARPIGAGTTSESSMSPKDRITYKTAAPKSAESDDTDQTKPAYVNQIDFVSEGAGRTALIIETSRPVKYEVNKAGDKKLEFKLFNTQIPDDLRQSVSANKTGGAISRLSESKAEPGNSAFDIEMREEMPYTAEQSGNRLKLNFVPPTRMTASSEIPAEASPSSPSAMVPPTSPPSQFQIQPIPSQPPTSPAQTYTPIQPVPVAGKGMAALKDLEPKGETKDDAAPKYTGEKIALDFYETDIKNVFRILREVSNMNFAIDKDVTGKVTLTLAEPVPWDQVLDLVLKMNKLGKTVDNNVIRIATVKTLDEEEKTRQAQKKSALEASVVQKQLEPFVTEYVSVNYSDAEKEVLPLIKDILTKDRGDSKEKATASVDKRTNMIIITDTAEIIKRAKEMIDKLDRVTPQVMIEARIVEATSNFSKEIGTSWGSNIGIQNTDANAGKGPEAGYNMLGGTYGYNMSVNLPTATPAGSIGYNFKRIVGTPFDLDIKLMAMESQGQGKIVSSPKVLTLDNKKATIKQGLRYPYNKSDVSGNTTTVFEEVDLSLEVTPHVTPDNRISMLMSITKKDIGAQVAAGYTFTNKEAKTELLINDGETVVIGGITKQTEKTGNTGLPGLSKIPILGWLFKSKNQTDDKEELLIFITPRILQLEQRSVQN